MWTRRARSGSSPADLVVLCAFALFNVRLMLLSGIGKPYDRDRGEGVVGRNYAYQSAGGSTAYFEDVKFNPFAASGSLGVAVDDYNSDNFDHSRRAASSAAPASPAPTPTAGRSSTGRCRPGPRPGAAPGSAR